MLVKNLLKRGLSVLICAAMLAVMFTSVTALAEGYEITDSIFVDDLNDTNYLYSYPKDPGGWHLTPNDETFTDNGNPVSGYKVKCTGGEPYWSIDDKINITYKAGGNKKFTKATFTIWINNDSANEGKFPIVKAKKADADSKLEPVSTDSDWTTLIGASSDTGWFRKSECTVYFPDGAVEAGLGFKIVNNVGLQSSAFIFDKAEFMTGNEVTKLNDDCSSLNNMWLAKNLNVVSDVVGDGDYDNNGYMIGVQKGDKPYEAIYKMPEGRKLTYLSMEYSVQDSQEPKIEFSSDGGTFKDSNLEGVLKKDPAGPAGDAQWAKVKTVTYTPSESENIRFIKIYGKTPGNYQFYLRKVLAISNYSLFKKDGETVTNLNGKAESGNLFGKIYYTPKSGETKFYAIIALKENGIIKNIGLKNFEDVTSARKMFETPELNCEIKDNTNTVVEVYLFNMTNDSLKPVLSEKGEFSSK